jgi:hypothetical protein
MRKVVDGYEIYVDLGDDLPPEKQPFGACLDKQMAVLDEIYNFVKKMRKKGSKKGAKMIFFQKGVLLNCRALPVLHAELTKNFPTEDINIETWYLSQDVLESLFSVLRAMGHSRPNALEVKHRLRRYMVQKEPDFILNSATTNVVACGPNNLTAQVFLKCCLETKCMN